MTPGPPNPSKTGSPPVSPTPAETAPPPEMAPVAPPGQPSPPGAKGSESPPGPAPGGSHDVVLLEGPQSRLQDLVTLFRAMWDFVRGFRALHFVGPCVTIFGSARFNDSHPYYAIGAGARPARGRPRLHRHDRRRARPHGSGQSRRTRHRRPLGRLQHRAAVRAGSESLSRSLDHVPLLLRAKGSALQVFVRVRRVARRPRHARRALRGADADSNKEDPGVSPSS